MTENRIPLPTEAEANRALDHLRHSLEHARSSKALLHNVLFALAGALLAGVGQLVSGDYEVYVVRLLVATVVLAGFSVLGGVVALAHRADSAHNAAVSAANTVGRIYGRSPMTPLKSNPNWFEGLVAWAPLFQMATWIFGALSYSVALVFILCHC